MEKDKEQPKKHKIPDQLESEFGTKKAIFNFETEKVGQLFCFPMSFQDKLDLLRKLGKNISDSSAKEFAKHLIMACCYPSNKLDENKNRPTKTLLENQDVDQLSESELEIFCSEYVKQHEYLYRKLNIVSKPADESGKDVSTSEYGDVNVPKLENETATDYLFRLYVNEEKKDIERNKKLFGHFSAFTEISKINKEMFGFSKKAFENINRTLSMGDALKTSLKHLEHFQKVTPVPAPPEMPMINHGELFRMQEEHRMRPYNMLSERLDELIELTERTSAFMVQSNETQTQIVSEVKNSNDTTTRYSKKSLILNIVIVFLTALSVIVAALSIYLATAKRNVTNDPYIEHSRQIQNKLDSLISVSRHSIQTTDSLLKVMFMQKQNPIHSGRTGAGKKQPTAPAQN
jgi:hypothetical protein